MTLHTKLSYVKSVIRIVGYNCLIWSTYYNLFDPYDAASHLEWIGFSGLALIAAELIGIVEEAYPGAYKGTDFVTFRDSAYPGQEYYRTNNKAVKKAEENWESRWSDDGGN